ncbi:uncharacterized protein A1O9_00183 [Exophiala aquamarina CBS 119918]|uniref:Uncharacterized protein n=1 Tax=Exophiala aquamarina CBS 119918 TaxID=1182545 RepID=A0A072PQR9_9EURO|nr:uncharacterized protein A1O9_00183 [Exophiala aquamarina CBS 119918]KEF62211.1 hypothetical protein A1O9_00183 [Exophiala aquamarina CBS 119918]
MPSDKQTKTSNASKPLTPALSSNFRAGRPAVAPRLAGSSSTSTNTNTTTSGPASATSSPALNPRKEPFVRSRSPGKTEGQTTPLSHNVTPRSGARKSRIGTESPSTPAPMRLPTTTVPKRSPVDDGPRPSAVRSPGLGIINPRLNMSTTALPNPATSSPSAVTFHRRVSAAKSMIEATKESTKFFHANEVKSPINSPIADDGSRLPPTRGQFFVGSPPLPVMPAAQPSIMPKGDEDKDTKFFRANDVPQQSALKRIPQLPLPTEQSNDGLTSQTLHLQQTASNQTWRATPPSSPNKSQRPFLPQPVSPRKYVPLNKEPTPPHKTRSSMEGPKITNNNAGFTYSNNLPGHRKSTSAGSMTAMAENWTGDSRVPLPLPLEPRSAPSGSPYMVGSNMLSPETLSPRSLSLASSNTVPTSITSDTDLPDVSKPPALLTNLPDAPIELITSPSHSHVDDAANARRERKVLDLEISNSSLLAINKTLERELRKQSAELRRFRRLSRSGRLSMVPTARSVSGQSNFSLGTVTEYDGDDQVSSENEEDSELDELDDEDDSLISNDSGSLVSQSARSRQRARDEKRLMLDLSKHQQLLIDSQKLSQSIKRCLTCTEELIRDGNKALDYRVGIGDVKLGGRVLNDEELDERGFHTGDDEIQARQGLLSPTLAKNEVSEVQTWAFSNSIGQDGGFPALEQMTELLKDAEMVLSHQPGIPMQSVAQPDSEH